MAGWARSTGPRTLRLGRKVALKLLAPELAENERFRERFLRESQLAASLDHPHIVPIYAAGRGRRAAVPGDALRRGLRPQAAARAGGPAGAGARARGSLAQVADALDAAHERGLIHRDVKPGNILIARAVGPRALLPGRLRPDQADVLDLGADRHGRARRHGRLRLAGADPRRARSTPAPTSTRSAACSTSAWPGEPPFARESEVATLWAHVNEPPPRCPHSPGAGPRDRRGGLARAREEPRASATRAAASSSPRRGCARDAARSVAAMLLRVRRLGRRPAALGRGRSGALVAVAVALVLFGGPDGLSRIGPTSVGVIDPATNELVADIPLGFKSPLIAAGERSIWIVDPKGNTLTRSTPPTKIAQPSRGVPGRRDPVGLRSASDPSGSP